MVQIGFKFPQEPRKTALYEVEDWYQRLLADKLDRPYQKIKRSNFGQYDMAVNYLTSVLEEARAINNVAVFNIDHMAQIEFKGKNAVDLLDRVLPADIASMRVGQCKYTLLLTEQAMVLDDMIVMRLSEDRFILVINAGHDLTDPEKDLISDADFICKYKLSSDEVDVKDISSQLVKIDIQGPLSYKLVTSLYGKEVVKNRYKPEKNMSYFTFNEFDKDGYNFMISRTGYTNRWGWEMYVPLKIATEEFKKIATAALDMGGLLVGLGGRDENRISAGNFGLPLNGNEYDRYHTPVNCPLFDAAIDFNKIDFIGKKALEKDIASGTTKRMVLFISEGIVIGRGIYLAGKRIGTVTSSINSPNIPREKREFLGSERKNVGGELGTAAIGLGWVKPNPFEIDENGKDILKKDGNPVRIRVEFYREDNDRNTKGKPLKGFISGDGVNPATSPKPLRKIENL